MASDYEHTHTPQGTFLSLSQTQDAAGDHCLDCGRSVYQGTNPSQNTQPHNHAMTCSRYAPHPASIAAQTHPKP